MMHPDEAFKKAVFWVSQNTNTFHPQFINDLNTLPGVSANSHDFFKKTVGVLTGELPSTAADSFSRYWTFSAMYEHYKGQGLTGQKLIDAACKGTDDTMVQYGRSNKAPIYQKLGIMGEMISPLQTFGQAQLEIGRAHV